MPRKLKSLLKKLDVESAERQRKCKNTGRIISKGSLCLVVWDSQFARANYSREIAVMMIKEAQGALDQLLTTLNTGSTDHT
jgi:hypothetical protein